MTNLNKEQIEFIDKLFVNLYKGEDRHELFRKSEYKLPEFDYLNNYDLDLAEKLNLVVLDKKYVNKIVVDFYKIPCENFIEKGGFKHYFRDEEWGETIKRTVSTIPIVTSVLGLIVAVVGLAFKIQNTTPKTETLSKQTLFENQLKTTDSTLKVLNQNTYNSTILLETRLTQITDSLYYSSLDTIKIDTFEKQKTHNKVYK